MFVSLPTRARRTLRWATPLLFALLWLAYLWASTRSGSTQRALLLDWGALTGGPAPLDTLTALWTEGRGLRLLTALFLHADWTHLLGNLIFLLIFGLPAERVMGPWRFLLLFLLGGVVANLAAVLMIGAPHRLIIGASGAVSAVIGAYLALFPRATLGIVVPLGLFLEFVRAPASLPSPFAVTSSSCRPTSLTLSRKCAARTSFGARVSDFDVSSRRSNQCASTSNSTRGTSR
jgi:membrane associated rhomboid family serine protease